MKICYFGIYNSGFGRNKIYIEALKKAGHTVIECRDDSKGLIKYFRLWQKHRTIKNDYDFVIVGYPGHMVVPWAKLLSKKKVIADALGSLYDAEVNSHSPSIFRKIKSRLADWLMVKFGDKILLESFAQKKYFEEKFGKSSKYEVVYTGVDDKFEAYQPKTKNNTGKFLVVFRGKLTPESGIMYILKAAEILKTNTNISFKIIGSGYLLQEAKKFIKESNLSNVELLERYLSIDELIQNMADADLLLGQFEDNPRLNRTIPHKAFEAMALGIPYLTADAPAVKEIVKGGENAFLVPLARVEALANRVELLSHEPKLLQEVAEKARKSFDEICSSTTLAEKITRIMLKLQNGKN